MNELPDITQRTSSVVKGHVCGMLTGGMNTSLPQLNTLAPPNAPTALLLLSN